MSGKTARKERKNAKRGYEEPEVSNSLQEVSREDVIDILAGSGFGEDGARQLVDVFDKWAEQLAEETVSELFGNPSANAMR